MTINDVKQMTIKKILNIRCSMFNAQIKKVPLSDFFLFHRNLHNPPLQIVFRKGDELLFEGAAGPPVGVVKFL